MEKNITSNILSALVCLIICGCQGYLDVKPDSDLVVPRSLEDFRQLLDNGPLMTGRTEIMDVMTDDCQIETTAWLGLTRPVIRNAYIWAEDIYGTIESYYYAWDQYYEQIFYANVVLDGLKTIDETATNRQNYLDIKGAAYFIRTYALYDLSQLYAPAYNPQTANTDLGIPVPLSSDVNERVTRGSIAKVYSQMLSDLDEAVRLLNGPVDFSRPSKIAALALRARILLVMGQYPEALASADQALQGYNVLTDLNESMVRDYRETIYLSMQTPAGVIRNSGNTTLIDSNLYFSYGVGDLRKDAFFRIGNNGSPMKKNSHGLGTYCFAGLDTDELYLIRAECYARTGNTQSAMEDLNHLLRHVFINYQDKMDIDDDEVLGLILAERRKQLVFRGLRWSDLKRLNRDGANISLARDLDGQIHSLGATSDKWLFPIPPNEIKTSGIPQNAR